MRCYKRPFSVETMREEYVPTSWGWEPQTEWIYFVHVCGFRFTFFSLMQIAEYKAFYSQPRKPSFRYIRPDSSEPNPWKNDLTRSLFHKLPMYLWSKGKRERVVSALDRAILDFAKGRK